MRWWSWMWLKQGQIEVDGEDESDYDGDECGNECRDVYAEKTSLAGIPFNTKLTSLHPLPNQSKPIVPTPSLSLVPTFSLYSITSRYTPSLSLL